ncbi:ABC efflux pump, inner membrane subunit [Candidatus Koribacter versatilis Ellin345]|uniref:ABC efflux pump, inner membrane subunit n=1 Tax=Koribacter versatilis (strain Ellin345) TaxID=204669 RepID=Q1IQI1_KORVE|nr:ABC transporter permease [Candidatus Koribacter versatilis]ABF40869.1 ABC efflux pump, inner membrane subunit [Candidatus Koribacter versatilis Ellin345]
MARRGNSGMFLRMMMRAALVRKGSAMAALLAVVVAASVATAMLNIYVDMQSKLQKEFRNYGANIIIVGRDGGSLPEDALGTVDKTLAGRGTAVPFSYAVAKSANEKPVVVAGTDFARVKQLNRWWSVAVWPEKPMSALVGARAMENLSRDGAPFSLTFNGKALQISPAGTLNTGADEDSRVYLSLPDFTAWAGLQPSTIEVGANGTAAEVEAIREQLVADLPAAEVKPVRQIVEAEGRVLGKARAALLASAIVIIVTAILCVVATLTAWVMEQRKNFAIMKALGASERIITGFFAAEAAALGVVGAIAGFVVGLGVAAWIARANFQAAITPRFSVLPMVLVGSVALALISALLPIGLLRRVQPATILRGE